MKLTSVAVGCLAALAFVGCGSDSDNKKHDAAQEGPDLPSVRQDVGQPDMPVQPDVGQPDQRLQPDTVDAPKPVDLAAVDAPAIEVTVPVDGGPIDAPQADKPQTVDSSTVDAVSAEARPPIVLDGGQRMNGYYVELSRAKFQSTIDGKATDLYTIKNSKGAFAKITNLGAKLEQIVMPDREGVWGDIILGYETIDTVKNGQGSMGAFIGRYANRIGGGTFTLDGTTYSIEVNETPANNLLHGGAKGSRFRVFDATQLSDASVKMTLTFQDAEDAKVGADGGASYTGFPGTVEMTVTYSITETNEIHLDYSAKSLDTKNTVINMTGHSFWNLANDPTVTILDHVVKVNADKVLEINSRLLPTGVLRDVTGTPMDFRAAKAFRQDYMADYDLLKFVGGGGTGVAAGYDNHYALNKTAAGTLEFAASAYEPVSGRKMEVWSTEPGMQLFTGTNLTGQVPRDVGKGGLTFQKYYAFCMEPSHFPDSPNQPSFPSTTLAGGATYTGQIVYKFGIGP